MSREPIVCAGCGRDRDEVRLDKCVICHQRFCRACAVRRYGKYFCSRDCAEIFFFGSDEE